MTWRRLRAVLVGLVLVACALPASATLTGRRVTATGTAAVVSGPPAANQSSLVVFIRNTDSTNSIYLGAAGVTSGTGFELVAGAAVSVILTADDVVYGITGGSSVRADLIERVH